ncbi:glycogen synthase GlgA [Cucumibacter marinus]|uniref:glycogen synthase GlgA n=1 Tax=Cucumibacter marinus TaxID=1121252 RepID=UPI00048DFE1F|nr:glycogen synthase GlgA [Cucumibacter marinus]
MEILSVTSEIYPLVKTGGLADVAGALPMALKPHGHKMRTVLPGYPKVVDKMHRAKVAAEIKDLFGGPARLLTGRLKGLDLIVIDAPHLYAREGSLYTNGSGGDWPDNWKRFAALGWVAAELAHGLIEGYEPDILHAHDWQGAMACAYLRYHEGKPVPSIITIHNLAFQGRFSAEIFSELRLPDEAFSMDGVEYYGGVGFLKAGLASASAITTVSPSYAREVRTAEGGMGLQGLLDMRFADLHGITNGIDLTDWDPAIDKALNTQFTAAQIQQRAGNKRALEVEFELDSDDGPLFGVVSRLTWQKGIDVLVEAADRLVALGGRLAVLGSGESALEGAVKAAAQRHEGRIGVKIGYDENLSHLMQGGADAMIVPSRFEPCGLTQLYALRYGCVPVVSRVGGLADTIIDANDAALSAGVATGIQFAPLTVQALGDALARAVELYEQPKIWRRLQRCGMKSDVSWSHSASRYAALYEDLLASKEG